VAGKLWRSVVRNEYPSSPRFCGAHPESCPDRTLTTALVWVTIRIGAMRTDSSVSEIVPVTVRQAPTSLRHTLLVSP
jgi:hypothetical protein